MELAQELMLQQTTFLLLAVVWSAAQVLVALFKRFL